MSRKKNIVEKSEPGRVAPAFPHPTRPGSEGKPDIDYLRLDKLALLHPSYTLIGRNTL